MRIELEGEVIEVGKDIDYPETGYVVIAVEGYGLSNVRFQVSIDDAKGLAEKLYEHVSITISGGEK